MKLTTHLPTITPAALNRATTHPFLRAAGSNTLPKHTLAAWLSQDRLYAQTYVRFIGQLLSKIHLPLTPSARGEASITEKILGILIDALNNIHRELKFFEDVAREYALDLNTPPMELEGGNGGDKEGRFGAAPITRAYIDMFMSASAPGTSLLEGLVVLWATEICYLRAWRYAAGFLEKREGGEDTDGGALREQFIPNWASDEFEEFVAKIGDVVDEVAALEIGGLDEEGKGKGVDALERCERWWRQVVWLEERFWPDVRG